MIDFGSIESLLSRENCSQLVGFFWKAGAEEADSTDSQRRQEWWPWEPAQAKDGADSTDSQWRQEWWPWEPTQATCKWQPDVGDVWHSHRIPSKANLGTHFFAPCHIYSGQFFLGNELTGLELSTTAHIEQNSVFINLQCVHLSDHCPHRVIFHS